MRSRGDPTPGRPPTRPPRPPERGGSPGAGRRDRPGWTLLWRNASDALLALDGRRRCAWILDPAVEYQVDAAGGDQRVGHDQGSGELADAEITYGLDTGPQDLGR